MPIYKHTITVEVLSEEEDLSGLSLDQISYEMMEGDFMGVSSVADVKELSNEEVMVESYAMGGEPDFFGEEYASTH